MRKLLTLTILAASLGSFAQEAEATSNDTIPRALAKKVFIYNAAKLYNDPVISRMALYDLLSENPNNIALRDSLALSYLQDQQYASAALVSQEVVSAVPDNMFAAEIAAVSFERLGVKSKALNFYEKLYLNDPDNVDRLYKMAFLQLDLKLFEESLNTSNQLIEHPKASEMKLVFPTENGQGQEVSMKLAAIRLKALVEQERGNKEMARKYLAEVLTEAPTFEVVVKQLESLN